LALASAFAVASCGVSGTTGTTATTNTTVPPKATQSTQKTQSTTEKPTVHKHTYGDWVILNESTCGERGKKTRYCTECGEADSTVTLPPVAHSYKSEVIAPTKSEDGYTKFTCTECGKSYTEDPVPALGSQGLSFIPLEGENYDKPYCAVIGIGFCTDTEIVIPSNVDGYEVLAIYSEAFKNQTQITSVKIPDTVTTIQDRAFQGCTGLTEFTFPSRMMWAGKYIFSGCDNLETINFRFSSAAAHIDENMLSGATAFKTATFDSHCLHKEIFYGNQQIETIIIKENTRIIESQAFWNCQNLKHVIFEEGDKWLSVENAFSWCQNIETIKLSSAIKGINSDNFSSCYSLSYVVISKDIKPFSQDLFRNLPLESVYYLGSEADWENVKALEENPTIAAAKRYYYSEEPLPDGNHWRYVDGVPTVWE
jgi:hypothetical protein